MKSFPRNLEYVRIAASFYCPEIDFIHFNKGYGSFNDTICIQDFNIIPILAHNKKFLIHVTILSIKYKNKRLIIYQQPTDLKMKKIVKMECKIDKNDIMTNLKNDRQNKFLCADFEKNYVFYLRDNKYRIMSLRVGNNIRAIGVRVSVLIQTKYNERICEESKTYKEGIMSEISNEYAKYNEDVMNEKSNELILDISRRKKGDSYLICDKKANEMIRFVLRLEVYYIKHNNGHCLYDDQFAIEKKEVGKDWSYYDLIEKKFRYDHNNNKYTSYDKYW